jgi:hypothetical protein
LKAATNGWSVWFGKQRKKPIMIVHSMLLHLVGGSTTGLSATAAWL